MATANTLEVRKIVRDMGIYFTSSWTDKASEPDMRLVAFDIFTTDAEALKQKVVQKFADLGYDNRIKVTGGTFLRIKASYKA